MAENKEQNIDSDIDIAAGFEGFVAEAKEKTAKRWEFWELAMKSMSGNDVILNQTEPASLKYALNAPEGMATGVLIIKCKDSITRYELTREKQAILSACNEYLPQGKKLKVIVFK